MPHPTVHVPPLKSLRVAACAVAFTLVASCAQISEPSFEPAAKPGSLGALDSAYDRTKWRWVRNADGRLLLSHTEIRKCFIDPEPDEDFNDPGFRVTRDEKTIGAARYDIVNVFEKRDFWQAIYLRSGSKTPLLGVYADGPCRSEAERILEAYEKNAPKPPLQDQVR
jgi:hypothetical protein